MKILFYIVLLLSLISFSTPSKAGLDPRVKTIVVMSGYGLGGGTLIGLASLGFGAKPRSIFIGASLGLYAGLLFGSYIVATYEMKKRGMLKEENYYPEDPASPYDAGAPSAFRIDPNSFHEEYSYRVKDSEKNESDKVLVYVPLVNYHF